MQDFIGLGTVLLVFWKKVAEVTVNKNLAQLHMVAATPRATLVPLRKKTSGSKVSLDGFRHIESTQSQLPRFARLLFS